MPKQKLNNPPPCRYCSHETVATDRDDVWKCPSCGRKTALKITKHVREDRWRPRADDPTVNPIEAWNEAIVIPDEHRDLHRMDGDEFRYHHETTTVLIRRRDGLRTVFDARTARDGVKEAIIETLIDSDVPTRVINEALQKLGAEDNQFTMLVNAIDELLSTDQGNAVGPDGPNSDNPVGAEQ